MKSKEIVVGNEYVYSPWKSAHRRVRVLEVGNIPRQVWDNWSSHTTTAMAVRIQHLEGGRDGEIEVVIPASIKGPWEVYAMQQAVEAARRETYEEECRLKRTPIIAAMQARGIRLNGWDVERVTNMSFKLTIDDIEKLLNPL